MNIEQLPKPRKWRWRGINNYLFPAPIGYDLSVDESTGTYNWWKSEDVNLYGFKSWFGVKLSAWVHKLFIIQEPPQLS